MTVREKLSKGDFNYMNQTEQPDGSTLITLIKRGDIHIYKLWIKNLYKPNEEVIKEEIT